MVKSIVGAELAVCEGADSFLQSAMWGRFKSRFEWTAHAFVVDWEHGGARPLLVLSRRIAPGIAMAYVPWGPELPDTFPPDPSLRAAATAELARALRPLLPKPVAFIRFDPPWFVETPPSDPHSPFPIPHSPFRKAAADIQPPDTVLIDLSPSAGDILAAMKPKWRYNIALAEKRGVAVSEAGETGIDVFYRLLTETAARDGIAVHSSGYYRALFEECGRGEGGREQIRLYTAGHEGDVLAAIVVLFRAKQAVYLYGASANVKRNLMAPYALQWRAMQDAKALGCTQYDLFGIPPNEDPDHPMAGLYRFKTGFGGTIVHRPGSWDYPCKPPLYALFCSAERLRKKLRDRRKGKSLTQKHIVPSVRGTEDTKEDSGVKKQQS
jgi:lipid II:glycine glycyltransferase (peptidoglycan interpeptide bridge formation enzyme)